MMLIVRPAAGYSRPRTSQEHRSGQRCCFQVGERVVEEVVVGVVEEVLVEEE
jgi:hypothetical protein